MLSKSEERRYNRHIILSEIGREGQENLKKSNVLIVGAGGLGCAVLQYLVAAGVGNVGVIDYDIISESNLQRQILYNHSDIGKYKVSVAKEKLQKQNKHIKITTYKEWLNIDNVLNIFDSYNVIIDCTDNFSTRYMINDACVILNRPFVYASIYKFEGLISVFNYKNGPSYRCLFPNPPQNSLENCSDIGVLGVLPGVLGTLQANETLKIILNKGNVLSGKLNIINLLENTNYTINVNKNIDTIECVKNKGLLDNYDLFCNEELQDSYLEEITFEEAKKLINNINYHFIDVRESWEISDLVFFNSKRISIDKLKENIDNIPRNKNVIIFCNTGKRSKQVINFLKTYHKFNNLINIKEGVG